MTRPDKVRGLCPVGSGRARLVEFSYYSKRTELNGTPVRELQFEFVATCVQNWLSTDRPNFAAANQVVTLTYA